ncbi:hypothetical protein CRYUN_Cryun32bG0056400 [Craigia yunnanensis]
MNVIGTRRAFWRIVSSIEQKEERHGNVDHVSVICEYRAKIEAVLSEICVEILKLIDEKLVPAAGNGDSKVFYLKMKGDYHRYLAEFKTGDDRKAAAENTFTVYRSAKASNAYLQFLQGPDTKMLLEFVKEMPKPETKLRIDFSSLLGTLFFTWVILQLFPQWHPDRWTRTPSLLGEAKRKFQQIQEAYSVLSDQRKRTLYDAGLYDPEDEEDEGFSDFLAEMISLMTQTKTEFPGNEILLVGVCPMYLSKDTFGVLSPFKFSRRATREKDVPFKVIYSGICHSDLHMVKNEWGSSIYPLVPRHEIAGEVTEVGSKSLDAAAPLFCAGITVYSPLKFYGLDKPDLHVGVVGLGGLGHMTEKFTKAMGAKVTVISTSPNKKKEALDNHGVDSFLLAETKISFRFSSENAGIDKLDGIIDTVSAQHPLLPLLGLLKSHGKLVLVGGPEKPLELPAFPLLQGRKVVGGSCIGGMKETQAMIDFAAEHSI